MLPRFIAFLLIVVLLWSGVAPADQVVATTVVDRVELQSPDEPAGQPLSGSANDRLADELPAPSQAEASADLPAMLTDCTPVPASTLTMVRPRPYAALPRLAPYLDGPQRPPCATRSVA